MTEIYVHSTFTSYPRTGLDVNGSVCSFNVSGESIQILNVDELVLDDNLTSSITTTPASAIDNSSIHVDGHPDRLVFVFHQILIYNQFRTGLDVNGSVCSFNVLGESIQILNVDELVLDDNLTSSITTTASAIDNSSIHMDGHPDRLMMPEESIPLMNDKPMLIRNPTSVDTTSSAINNNCAQKDKYPNRLKMPKESIPTKNDEPTLDGNPTSVDTTSSAIFNNCAQKDKYPNSVDNQIIVGWAILILLLGLVTFSFPTKDVPDYHCNEAFIIYIMMLILELGIWIPLWTYMSPPSSHLKTRNFHLHVSFLIFNLVSNSLQQIISSMDYLNHGRLLTFINLFCGVVGFFMVSTLFWLTIDLDRDGFKWEHLSLGCNAALSATLLNISVFQLIVKKSFLHFPLFAILRDVIDLIDLIIRIVHNKEEHCQGRG